MSKVLLTPAALAQLRERLAAEGFGREHEDPIRRRDDPNAPLPLTPAQRRLWMLDQVAERHTAYVIATALVIEGPVDAPALEAACRDLIERHEALRTTFPEHADGPVGCVSERHRPDVAILERPSATASSVRTETEAIVRCLVETRFDLASGPLARFRVVRFGPDVTALALVMHHLVADRWSIGVILQDLIALYLSRTAGLPSRLTPLDIGFGDYASWLAGRPAGRATADIAYWRSVLNGSVAAVDLPFDRDRPRVKSYAGGSARVRLDHAVAGRVRGLAIELGTTTFVVLAAALRILLARVGDNPHVVIGTPVANRHPRQTEAVVGLFLNAVPLRLDLDGEESFRRVVQDLAGVCLDAFAHERTPLEEVVAAIGSDRSAAHTTLFEVLISFTNVPMPVVPGGVIAVTPLPVDTGKGEFDLLLDLSELDGEIVGRLEFNADVMEQETARLLAELYERLMAQLVAAPDRQWVLASLGQSASSPVPSRAEAPDVVSTLAAVATRSGSHPAVVTGRRRVSYTALFERARTLAAALAARGVGPNVDVAVLLERGVDLAAAVVAILDLGACYRADIQSAADVEDLALVVVTGPDPDPGMRGPTRVLRMDELLTPNAGPAAPASGGRPGARSLDERALVLADATGTALTRRDLNDRIADLVAALPLDPATRTLWAAPWAALDPIWQLLWPLACGATIVLVRGAPFDADATTERIVRDRVTTVVATAALPLPGADAPEVTSIVELVHEPTRPPTLRRHPGTSVVRVLHDDRLGPLAVVGPRSRRHVELTLLPSWRARVDDPWGSTLPAGLEGRIGVAREGRLDSDVVLHDTGLSGRLDRFGLLRVSARRDRVAQVMGRPVDLARVERVLATAAGVADAVASVAIHAGKTLVAAWLVGPESAVSAAKRTCAGELPDYAVPATITRIPAIPRHRDGSVAWEHLPAPTAETTPAEPRDEVDEALYAVWTAVLGRPPASTTENFFAAGGHSILAVRLAAAVAERTGVTLALRDIFEDPTIAGLAERLRTRTSVVSRPLVAQPRDQALPLSFAQESLVRHHPIVVDDPHHNVVIGVVLHGPVSSTEVEAAVTDLIGRHEPLRTAIIDTAGTLTQHVADRPKLRGTRLDLSGYAESARREALAELVGTQARTPLPINQAPLIRLAQARLGAEDLAVVLTMHHIVTDNWSFGVLVRDLSEILSARIEARPARLPELSAGYADFAAWQRAELDRGSFDASIRYWAAELARLPEPPTWRPLREVATYPSPVEVVSIPAELVADLRALGSRADATLFMVAMATFQITLWAHSDADRVATVFPDAGRQHPGAADLVGYFVTHPIVATDLAPSDTFDDVLSRVRSATLAAYDHAEAPAWLAGPGPRGRVDPGRYLINLLSAPVGRLTVPQIEVLPLQAGPRDHVMTEVLGNLDPTAVDVGLVLRDVEDGLVGNWLSAPGRLDPGVVASVRACWPEVLRLVVAGSGTDLGHLRAALQAEAVVPC